MANSCDLDTEYGCCVRWRTRDRVGLNPASRRYKRREVREMSKEHLPESFLEYIESFLEQHQLVTFPDRERVYKVDEWKKDDGGSPLVTVDKG